MQKLQTFFRTLWLSISSPKYYADILKARFNFSLKYLIFFNFLLSMITAAVIMIPVTAFDAQGALEQVKKEIPSDLQVNIENGELQINKPLPYKLPSQGMSMFSESDNLRYGVVFESDENIKGAADVLDQQAIFVLTETTAYVRTDEQNKLETYSFSEVKEPLSLNSTQVFEVIDQVKNHPFVAQKLYIPLIGFFLFIVMVPFSILGALISAAMYGIAVWLMAKFFSKQLLAGQELKYSKAVQVTIHSSTGLILISQILNLVTTDHPFNGLTYFAIFLAWTAFLLYKAHHVEPEEIVQKQVSEPSPKSIDRVTQDPV